METISRLRYFLYLSILIVGCTTGKNALQKGDYDASVRKSVDRLRNSPKNTEALQVLATAYDLALKGHLIKIDEAKRADDVLRWEYILSNYQQMNELSTEVNSCVACLTVVPNPKQFSKEIAESQYKAAEVRYAIGLRRLAENNHESAKRAFYDFERAQQLVPNYKDVGKKLAESYQAAVVNVVVQPVQVNNGRYQLSNQYFQQQINAFIRNYQRNRFVQFYDEKQAINQQIVPDQVVSLRFNDFQVGDTYVKEQVEKIKRDSVIIGQTRNNKPIYATVKASFSVFNKQISSSGLLEMVILDYQTNRVIKQKQLAGTYIWKDSWAVYKGDERALTKQQLKMLGKREILPPAPDVLFGEFTKPIYAQLVDEVGYFYNQY
jgi:hypothetical protein